MCDAEALRQALHSRHAALQAAASEAAALEQRCRNETAAASAAAAALEQRCRDETSALRQEAEDTPRCARSVGLGVAQEQMVEHLHGRQAGEGGGHGGV
jgi:hypothetical protein